MENMLPVATMRRFRSQFSANEVSYVFSYPKSKKNVTKAALQMKHDRPKFSSSRFNQPKYETSLNCFGSPNDFRIHQIMLLQSIHSQCSSQVRIELSGTKVTRRCYNQSKGRSRSNIQGACAFLSFSSSHRILKFIAPFT